ncbi:MULTISPECIES: DUF6393 family protein [Xanthomonas]|uniref:DUF3887 domain-containing protein n=1 Tax=Xanthomonas arboricola TaxID=56448 RepID=A0AB73H440_9XANT|nr:MULTISPECIES: DUF6393 family protein [Xanthomonas]MBB5672656.1 hypothetical protein [Xanthomonas arboricola]
MWQHHTYATQLATPLVGSSLKTKASQTRQIVSTTSLRDAVWNSGANAALRCSQQTSVKMERLPGMIRTSDPCSQLHQEIALPHVTPSRWAATFALIGIAVLSLSSCTNAETARTASKQDDILKSEAKPMLDEIYASQKPLRLQQIDVSSIVSKYIPLATAKARVLEMFGSSPTSNVVEETAGKLVVRDNKEQAILNPDARSIVMTFSLDSSGKVTHVDAVYIKNQ